MKPDVCRRVVGRLPSPHIQSRLQKPLWFQQCEMAPPFSFAFFGSKPGGAKTMVVYLVRSLGLMPESVSHDWHVQPSCQRPNRGPPKRREFSPGGNSGMRARCPHHKETDCPRNLTSIRWCAKSCQSAHPTGFPDDFHNWTVLGSASRRAAQTKQQVPHRAFSPIRNDIPWLSARFGMTRLLGGRSLLLHATVCVFRSERNATFSGLLRRPIRKTRN